MNDLRTLLLDRNVNLTNNPLYVKLREDSYDEFALYELRKKFDFLSVRYKANDLRIFVSLYCCIFLYFDPENSLGMDLPNKMIEDNKNFMNQNLNAIIHSVFVLLEIYSISWCFQKKRLLLCVLVRVVQTTSVSNDIVFKRLRIDFMINSAFPKWNLVQKNLVQPGKVVINFDDVFNKNLQNSTYCVKKVVLNSDAKSLKFCYLNYFLEKAKYPYELVGFKETFERLSVGFIDMNENFKLSKVEDNSDILLNSDDGDLTELTRLLKKSKKQFEDKRVYEVASMLSSHFPKPIYIPKTPNITDMKYLRQQQLRLLQLSLRSLALPIARGMLTLKISQGYYHFPLSVPKLNLLGEIHENKATINLNLSGLDIPARLKRSFSEWPSFHNGVASGIMQVQTSSACVSEQLYFCEVTDSFTEAGVLLGRSLVGALDDISLFNCYKRVKRSQPSIRMALLLGLACSQASKEKLASRDQQIFKFICLHIPNAFPVTLRKLKALTPEVNSIAMLSLGIFKAKQHNRRMLTSFFISSLKAITACSKQEVNQLKCLKLFTGFALAFVGLNSSEREKLGILSELRELVDRKKYNLQGPKFSTLKQGKKINIGLYSPAVFVALSLLFVDTDNQNVLDILTIPNQKPAILKCSPEYFLLRLLCKTLVCKESLTNFTDIKARIPHLLFELEYIKQEGGLCRRFYAIAGVCLGAALKNGAVSNQGLVETIKDVFEEFYLLSLICKWRKQKKSFSPWALAKVKVLCSLKELVFDLPSSCIISDCLIITSNALALLTAASCNVSILRSMRKARANLETLNYGHHMGINMSIGLVFLSTGKCCVENSRLNLALLLLSFFPFWPKTPSDNEYHHQAVRNLYVLTTRKDDRIGKLVAKNLVSMMNPLYI